MSNCKMPFLTVGIPFFNNEKTLANAIKSVILQSYTNWELILLNDGSTDKSGDIAMAFAMADDRIKIVSDGVNRGLIYRLNQIIDMAKGKYIARMDSDDMMMPDKLAKQIEALVNDSRIDVIDTAAYIINEKAEPTGMRGLNDLSTWDKRKTFKDALLFHPTVMAKTNWYRENKYDKDFERSEDFELWCRAFNHTVFARVYEPLFIYTEGKVNVRNYVKSNHSHRKMLKKYAKGVLSKKELRAEIIESHSKSILYRIFSCFNLQHLLSAKRNMPLTPEQKAEVKMAINKINETKIFPALKSTG